MIPHVYREVLERFSQEIRTAWKPAVIGASLAFALSFAFFPRSRANRFVTPRRRAVGLAICLIAIVAYGAKVAWDLKWLSDDSYISFRYADNLVRGNGLVFNPGDRVEGYTNFLWTVLVALAMKLGADPGQFAIVLGIASYAGALIVSELVVVKMEPEGARVTLPLAALLLAANYSFLSFATSGLETMFAALLTIWSVERAMKGKLAIAGLLGIAATLSHPDHAIFYLALGAALAWDKDVRSKLWHYALPLGVVYVPYFIWRYSYYGDLFPNTYYAKSGGIPYFNQGGIYLYISLFAIGFWAILPLAIWGGVVHKKSLLTRFVLLGIPTYLVYVAKVGGDFMLGRLLCVVLPPFCILAELGVRALLDTLNTSVLRQLAAAGAAILGIAGTLWMQIVHSGEKFWHLADERTFYLVTSFSPIRIASPMAAIADSLNRRFQKTNDAPIVALGCVGIIGYESKLPLVDTLGLTDRYVAHSPIGQRGRPGHEKHTPPSYLFERQVDLSDRGIYPEKYNVYSRIFLDGVEFFMSHYDAKIIRDVGYTPRSPIQLIEEYTKENVLREPGQAMCDAWFLEAFYFRSVRDPERRQAFLQRMVEARAMPTGAEALFARQSGAPPPGFTAKTVFDFDRAGPQYSVMGAAFEPFPALSAPPPQDAPSDVHGGFADTWNPKLMDLAVGRLATSSFPLNGDFLSVRIGGGQTTDVGVSLRVGNSTVATLSGCDTEITGERFLDIRPFRGQLASIDIVDNSVQGWGHVVVDDVILWTKK